MPSSLTPEQQVQRLRNQIGWVTRLSAAISATSVPDDIVSLILTGVVSPTCLGYTRVLLFEHNEQHRVLRGLSALVHESRESYDDLARELEEEQAYIRHRSNEGVRLPGSDDLDDDVVSEDMHWLVDNSQWVTLSQRLTRVNPTTERLQRLSFSTLESNGRSHLFQEAPQWRSAHALNRTRLGARVPAALASLLTDNFAVAPLIARKGLRGLLVVDRWLEPDVPFTKEELDELDWFARQAALAIENAMVSTELNRAYSDLKQLDQMKSNFLSVISHELRTPLTAMAGFVDLIVDERCGPVNENQRTLLTRVAKNTHHLCHLVNDLIEVAHIEAEGTIEVTVASVDPLTVLMDTIPRLEQRRREADVKVEPIIDGPVPRILTDEKALGRIFFHLLDNGMKFSPPGSTVDVRFRVQENELFIEIRDRGVGISRDEIRHIFDHFYQVDNTLTRGFEGLGLGLAVTKMLIQATRGRLLVESEEGQGSTFTMVYPTIG